MGDRLGHSAEKNYSAPDMTEIWCAEIFHANGTSTGLRSNLSDIASVLELIYNVRRSGRNEIVRVMPPPFAGKDELHTIVEAGAAIVSR